ncbi:MAG: hypothetical protein HYX28_04850 [Candidatus Koribacter versatilis]|uniref:Uncharacterized protein n=1 Tax=Candidatus Korobacter versatilis TaxID=658062 RepID=A0A932EP67_9BACT|nr:hypothetical protein [Candidatus Koribacter versatilis]
MILAALLFLSHKGTISSTEAGTVAAFVLVYITLEYVITNHEILAVMKNQWARQSAVLMRFGLRQLAGEAQVWIANFGLANLMVIEVRIESRRDDRVILYKHAIIAPGVVKHYAIPKSVYQHVQLFRAYDVSVKYFGIDEVEQSASRAYTLLVSQGRVVKIKRGIHEMWGVDCPKCMTWPYTCMITDGLQNYEEAVVRMNEMAEELRETCPDHASKWTLTTEHANKKGTKEDVSWSDSDRRWHRGSDKGR